MKRPRASPSAAEEEEEEPPLGASAFASILQGEDPNAVYRALRRFARTVRRERRVALGKNGGPSDPAGGGDIDESTDSEDDKELDEEEADAERQKKLKKDEAWKEDSGNYNVPFVGTAVSSARDAGTVVVGEWPTGLLQAYLLKSPLAVEVMGDALVPGTSRLHKTLLKSKRGKLSHAIHKAWLEVIHQIISAAKPLESDSSPSRLVSELIRQRLPGLLVTLCEETGNGKGKAGTSGGCGPLAPPVLRILAGLSSLSVDTCRQIMRSAAVLLPEAVVRFIVKSSGNKETDQEHQRIRLLTQLETLRWTNNCLAWQDPVISSLISSPGVRDKKIPPGLLFLTFKELAVIPGHLQTSELGENLAKSMCTLLVVTRHLLVRRKIPKQQLADIFSRDCIQNLCRWAAYAPKLSDSIGFRSVLRGTDDYPSINGDGLEEVGIDARRLVLLLIGDPEISPLLHALRDDSQSSVHRCQLLARAVILLLDTHKGLEIQKFIIYATKQTPQLLLGVFQHLSLPDSREVFSFISLINFLSRMISSGPHIQDCIGVEQRDAKNQLEQVVLASFPSCLRKNQIQKALWHNNALVVASTLKFLFHTLNRIKYFVERCRSVDQAEMIERLVSLLPDPQTYHSIVSRYKLIDGKHNAVIVRYTFSVIEVLMDLFQEKMRFSTTEWTKVLAVNMSVSLNSPAVLLAQRKVLSLLKRCIMKKDNFASRPGFLRDILTIALTTDSTTILDQAKEVAVQILFQIAAPLISENESRTDIDYELRCWIDGMRLDCLDEFCSMLDSLQATFQGRIGFSNNGNRRSSAAVASDPNISNLLVAALSKHLQAGNSFVLLVHCVAGRCLIQHSNPLPLAALVASLEDNIADIKVPHLLSSLVDYAKVLLSFPNTSAELRMGKYKKLIGSIYSRESLADYARDKSLFWHTQDDSELKLRQATHQLICDIMPSVATPPKDSIHLLVPLCLKTGWTSPLSAWDKIGQAYDDSLHLEIIVKTSRNAFVLQQDQWTPYLPLLVESETGIASISSTEERMALYLNHFLAFRMPASSHLKWATILLRRYVNSLSSSYLQQFWRSLSMDILDATFSMHKFEDTDGNLYEFEEAAFKVWLLSEDVQLLQRLESIFCRILFDTFGTSSISSCMLLGIMRKYEPLVIMERCLVHGQEDPSLLSALIENDYIIYGKALIEVIASHREKKFWLESGRLHIPICAIFRRAKSNSHWKHMDIIETSLVSRMISVLHQKGSVTQSPDKLLSALKTVINHSENHSLYLAVGEALTELLDRYSEQLDDHSWELPIAHDQMLSLGMCLCKTFHENSCPAAQELSRSIFVNLLSFMSRTCKTAKSGMIQSSLLRSHLQMTVQLLKLSRHESWLHENSIITNMQLTMCEITDHVLARLEENVHECNLSEAADLFQTIIRTEDVWFLDQLSSSMDRIFKSAVGHKSFRDLITGHTYQIKDKHAALTILGSCLYSLKSIDVEEGTMELFLQGFNAGITKCDYLLRALMNKYMRLATDKSPIYLDQLQWADVAVRDRSRAGWDWLPSAMDVKRVQLTLNRFPIHDNYTVDLSALLNAESTESGSPQGPDEDPSDQRYCPGFLLSLILSALLDLESDVALAQRLCERGSIALALAALCSRCSVVRQLALSILGRFIVILQSERARSSPSWRDRPQLLMLIQAVHQALAIKSVEEKWTSSDIRKLPGMSAIFLAKASIVLSRPSDGLYSFINRFFLRTEEDHGAFQDLYRLPGFVSLSCSTAEDSQDARAERVWALKLICDGFLEEDCYQPLNSCHALELILSNIDINSKIEQETALALKALRTILVYGGSRCEVHMFRRLGLIYWMRSLLISWPRSTPPSCMAAYLSLLVTVVERAPAVLQEEAVPALLGLTEQLLASPFICRDSFKSHNARQDGTFSQYCKVFIVIGQTWRTFYASEAKQLRLDGFTLSNALTFLNLLTDPSDKLQAYRAFCMMPCCSAPEAEETFQFCVGYLLLLTTTTEKLSSDEDRDMVCITFSRLQAMVATLDLPVLRRERLVETLCRLQAPCFRAQETRDAFVSLLMSVKGEAELSRPLQTICSYSHA